MEKHDYEKEMKHDIKEFLEERLDGDDIWDLTDREREEFYDEAFVCDSVTGNASGSYTFSTWKAEENICHNMDLALEAYQEFGYDGINSDNAETIDVTIRCYLLGTLFDKVVEEMKDEQLKEV